MDLSAVTALDAGLERFPTAPLPALGRRLGAARYRALVARMEAQRVALSTASP